MAFDFCFGEAGEDVGIAEKHPWCVSVEMSVAHV